MKGGQWLVVALITKSLNPCAGSGLVDHVSLPLTEKYSFSPEPSSPPLARYIWLDLGMGEGPKRALE